MLDIPVFWYGPIGRMIPLACPEAGLTDSLDMQAATNVSVNMNQTVDVQGYRRHWEMDQAWLVPEDVDALHAMYTGLIQGPKRIIDPLQKNRLPMTVSNTRAYPAWSMYGQAWAVDNGAMIFPNDSTVPNRTFTSQGDQRVVSYRPDTVARFTGAVGSIAYPTGKPQTSTKAYSQNITPIIAGETVTLSFMYKTVGAAVPLQIYLVDETLTLTSPITVGIPPSTNWTTFAYTMPNVNASGVYFTLNALSASADIRMAYIQLEQGPVATPWRPGYGSPISKITSLSGVSPRHPMMTTSMTIQEL